MQKLSFGHEWKSRRQPKTNKISFKFAWTYSDFDNFPFSEKFTENVSFFP